MTSHNQVTGKRSAGLGLVYGVLLEVLAFGLLTIFIRAHLLVFPPQETKDWIFLVMILLIAGLPAISGIRMLFLSISALQGNEAMQSRIDEYVNESIRNRRRVELPRGSQHWKKYALVYFFGFGLLFVILGGVGTFIGGLAVWINTNNSFPTVDSGSVLLNTVAPAAILLLSLVFLSSGIYNIVKSILAVLNVGNWRERITRTRLWVGPGSSDSSDFDTTLYLR